ncbi:hypothetical protein AXX17_AT1G38610 [Arabidopsis thaliana]|uniref:Uncharacterized protein n=1 Tax=Arabidopsis thaliana TaxID=3702 RepID=A0A178WNE0_ARATH|nr:hypothetical protein AXX17_AT1G38610 [Arabidopsis thaliana]
MIPDIVEGDDRHHQGVARHQVGYRAAAIADERYIQLADYNKPDLFYANHSSYSTHQAHRPPTSTSRMEYMLEQILKSQVITNQRIDGLYNDFQDLNARIDRKDVSVVQLGRTINDSTFDGAKSSELDTKASTTNDSVHEQWTRTAPYFVEILVAIRTEQHILEERCFALCDLLLEKLPYVDYTNLWYILHEYIWELILNGVSDKDASLLNAEIITLLMCDAPRTMKDKLAMPISEIINASDPGSYVLDCSISTEIPIVLNECDVVMTLDMDKLKKPPTIDGQAFSVEHSIDTSVEIDKVHGTSGQLQKASHDLVAENQSGGMDSIDTTTYVDRHPTQAELEFFIRASFCVEFTVDTPGTIVKSPTAPLLLDPPPKRLRYSSPPLKPLDFINKSKRSRPPIPLFCTAKVPHFLCRPHTANAYTPPWMMRGFSPRYFLPPSDPPDSRNPT